MSESNFVLFAIPALTDSEVAKALFAAALALTTAIIVQIFKMITDYRELQRKRIVAGNLALAALRSYSDNLKAISDSFAKSRKKFTPAMLESHPWLEFKWWPYILADPPVINYDALDFLFTGTFLWRGDPGLFADIFNAEQRYRKLIQVCDLHVAAGRKMYESLMAHAPPISEIDQNNVAAAEAVVGRANIEQIRATLGGFRELFAEADTGRSVVEALREYMERRFRARDILQV